MSSGTNHPSDRPQPRKAAGIVRYEDYLKAQQAARTPKARPPADRHAHAVHTQPRPSAAAPATAVLEPKTQKPDPELTDHNYDGIQEYDNPTPGWWHMIFVGTIVFSIMYVLVYHFSPAVDPLPVRHAKAEARALERQFAELNQLPAGELKLLKIMAEPKWLESGASIYAQSCALCHNAKGEGLVGPNLTDEYFKNATTLAGMYEVVRDGAGNGAMPAQKNTLHDNEIALVTAYVASLRGQNLDGPRGPEGQPIAAWPTLSETGELIPGN